MTKTKTLDEILDKFATWTIQNVEHGIYIPLPSPETEQAILEAVNEIIGNTIPEGLELSEFTPDLRRGKVKGKNELIYEQRERLTKWIEGEK